jgi:hypothetical protein
MKAISPNLFDIKRSLYSFPVKHSFHHEYACEGCSTHMRGVLRPAVFVRISRRGKTAGAKLSTHTDLYQAQVTLLPVFRAAEPLVGSRPDGFNWLPVGGFPLVASRMVSNSCQPDGFNWLPAGWFPLVASRVVSIGASRRVSIGCQPDGFNWLPAGWFQLVASRMVSICCQSDGFHWLPAGWFPADSVLRIRIRDPGLGAFLTPGSGIRDGRKSASGSGMNNPDHIF